MTGPTRFSAVLEGLLLIRAAPKSARWWPSDAHYPELQGKY